jgi:hypothetical protein
MILLLYALWYIQEALGSCPDPPPIALPITNVKLSNGFTKRGIPGSIGTPAQNFSFMPQKYASSRKHKAQPRHNVLMPRQFPQ